MAFHRLPLAILLFLSGSSSQSGANAFVPQPFGVSGVHIGRSRQSAIALSSSPGDDDLFPVLRKIQGVDWVGKCRYVDSDLQPAADLVLRGGSRFDIDGKDCTFTSFLAFPDGRSRHVIMKGRRGSPDRPSMRLESTDEEGPIYMVLTELSPDTVLLNEVDKQSRKIVMTASISLVASGQELVQVSHELGDDKTPVEGHQVWRLKKENLQETGTLSP